jgi:ribosomal-protein-alanine N-acetyltransferase
VNFEILQAKKHDLPDIMRILKCANMHYIPSKEMPDIDYKNCYVAKIGDRIVGVGGYEMRSKEIGKTTLLVVHPEFRKNGIGSSLQLKRIQVMIRKGAKKIITNVDNPKTIEWYKKKFGYKKIGKLKKYHEFGLPYEEYWTTLELDIKRWRSEYGGRNQI